MAGRGMNTPRPHWMRSALPPHIQLRHGAVPGAASVISNTMDTVATARRERNAQNSARAAVESRARFMDFSKEARKIFYSKPTPVFDAFTKEVGPITGTGSAIPLSVFTKYQKTLKETYPGCNTGVVALEGSGVAQPYEASQGWNYYNKLGEVERLCSNGGKTLSIIESELRDAFINTEMQPFMADFKEKEQLRKAEQLEKIRSRQVPTGDLLGLDEPNMPNLLRFEPTKEGLNAREKELEGLFGGSKKRSTRKSNRNRKNRRRHTRTANKK